MAKRRRLQLADVLSGRPVEHGTPLVLEISEKHHDVPMRFALPGTIALLVAGSRGEAVLKRMVAAVRAEDFAELERLHLRVVQRFGRALLDPRHDVRSPHDIAAFSSFRYRRKTLRRGLCTSSGLIVARSLALYDGAELDPKAFDVLHYRRADMQGPVHAVVIVRRPRLTPLEKKIIAQLPAEAAEVHFGEDVGFFTGAIVGAAAAEVGARAIEYVAQQIGVADYIHAVEHGAQDIYNAAVNGAHDVAHAAAQEVGIEGAINVAEGVVNVTEAVTSVTADIGKAAADVAVDFVADIVGAAVDWVAHNIFTVDDGKNDAGAQGNAGAGAADAGAGANAGAGAGDDNAGNNEDNQDNAGDDFADNAGDDAGDDEGGAGKDDEGGSFKSWVDQVENVADELQSIPAAAAVRELLALRIQMINAATTGQRTSLLGLSAVLATVAIIALLSAWFLLSLLNQYGRGALIRPIKRRDACSLIPIWTFFAPRPGVTDYNLLYRDRGRDGRCGPWHEIQPDGPRWWKGLWNPGKRVRKGATDMCNTLLRQAARKPGRRLYLQVPYLTLLHHACEQPRNELSCLRQFAIVRTFGFESGDEPQVVFISALHRLDPAAPAPAPSAAPAVEQPA